MIESKIKAKITPEEREYFLSKRNSEFIKEVIGRGIVIGFVYLLLLIPTLFSEGLNFLIKTEHLVMFCDGQTYYKRQALDKWLISIAKE